MTAEQVAAKLRAKKEADTSLVKRLVFWKDPRGRTESLPKASMNETVILLAGGWKLHKLSRRKRSRRPRGTARLL